jgi:hypothetical protein
MTPEQFIYCLGMTESGGNVHAWGDADASLSPRAIGRFQVHPDRLFEEASRYKLRPWLNETWDSFVGRVVTAMFVHRTQQGYAPDAIAAYWHQGHFAQPAEWDQHYMARWYQYAKHNG